MQKALITALLLIGAFLFITPSVSQELPAFECTYGGALYDNNGTFICHVPSPYGTVYTAYNSQRGVTASAGTKYKALELGGIAIAAGHNSTYTSSSTGPNGVTTTVHTQTGTFLAVKENTNQTTIQITNTYVTTCPETTTSCPQPAPSDFPIDYSFSISTKNDNYCPADTYPMLSAMLTISGVKSCYIEATPLPTDEEPPPECDIGQCEPPPEPKCFRGGAGQQVCFEDPNDKCDFDSAAIGETGNPEPAYSNCQAGCGFINGAFMCSDTPEIPSLDNCLVTTNGYACPSDIPEPDDDIADPNKPQADMAKSDFKDVLKGVETRSDATNTLLSDQIARDKENSDNIGGKLDKSNAYLKGIDANTQTIADSLTADALELEPDTAQSIFDGLGITGDEDITDLEQSVVSLDTYRNQFSYTAGSTSCPAPRTQTMLNKTFTLDWQPFCDAFSVIGYFVQAGALLLSGFIAFGVKK